MRFATRRLKSNGLSKLLLAAVAVFLLGGSRLSASVLTKSATINGIDLDYKVILPNGYDPAKTYPAVLAFPGAAQNMQLVNSTVERNWRQQAETRGYIVIVPAAPDGQLFFEGGAKVFPAFITELLADYKILDNKFHIAGVSNGGLSAFYIAARYPQYFWSVTGLPGFLDDNSQEHVRALSHLCIYMYAGELDPDWAGAEKDQAAQFRKLGYTVEFNEEKGEGHVMRTLDGDGSARLFQQFEQARRGCPAK